MNEILDFLSMSLVEEDSPKKLNDILDMVIKADSNDLRILCCLIAKSETTIDDVLRFVEGVIGDRYPNIGEEYILLKNIETNEDISQEEILYKIEKIQKGIVYFSNKDIVGEINIVKFRDCFRLVDRKLAHN